MKSLLDVLREAFTPNAESMLQKGELRLAMSRQTKKRMAAPLPCFTCGHPVAYIKDKEPRCAACLTLSAKMPRYSDPEKLREKRGLSPCTTQGGGMGMLLTLDSAQFFVQKGLDLVFLDTIQHYPISAPKVDPFLVASTQMAMDIPDGSFYWWGLVREADIYPTLEMFRTASWDIAQDTMLFHPGYGSPALADTRASWMALAKLKDQPDADLVVKLYHKASEEKDEKKRQSKLITLYQEHPKTLSLMRDITERSLVAHF